MTEKELINAAKRGDQAAYGQLIQKYHRGLTHHVTMMTHDSDLGDDLAQDAMIKAYFALDTYNDTYHFSTWIYRIATNKALDYLKRKHHISLESVPNLPSVERNHVLENENNAEHEAALRRLRQAITKLPLNYQTVISLYYWQHLTYPQIAIVMDVPINTIRTWLKRSKSALKEML